MDRSPLTQVREALGLSRTDAAATLGVSYRALWGAEHAGEPIPPAARQALGELGVDVAQLEREQAEWFAERAAQLRQDLRARIAQEAVPA